MTDNEKRINELETVLQDAFDTLEELRARVGYEIGGGETNPYGFKRLRQCELEAIPAGDIFETEYGELVIKSEYMNKPENEPYQQSLCIILGSGEFAHFKNKNKARVWQLVQPVVAKD